MMTWKICPVAGVSELLKPLYVAISGKQSCSVRDKRGVLKLGKACFLELSPGKCGSRKGGEKQKIWVSVLSSSNYRDGNAGRKR